jgi:hypothetical protein
MAVRIKLKLKSKTSGRIMETSALINTGFETESPQILIPVRLAKELLLYPPPYTSNIIEIGTAGGPSKVFLIRNDADIWVITENREKGPKSADILISLIEEEVLINDKLTEELNIIILAPGSGKWKFSDDPVDKIRYSEKPQYW